MTSIRDIFTMAPSDIKWDPNPNYFIFNDEVPGKTKMHVRRLKVDDWVKIDNTYIDQMALRNELIKTHYDDVFVSNYDQSAVACKWELFDMLVEYLPRRFPYIFDVTKKEGFIYNKVLDEYISVLRSDPEDPLIRAGRLTQEDWCIIEYNEGEGGYVLTSGCLCFPMRWSLQEKFNQVIGKIHEPVEVFTKHLKPSVYKTFVKMTPETPMWRANWAVFNDLDGPLDLFAATPSLDRNEVNKTTRLDENTGKTLVFRAEYQTLRKLPKTKCIVFGIRTYQRYLDDFYNVPDSDCEGLIKAIQYLGPEETQYKGSEFWRDAAIGYLQGIIDSRKRKGIFSGISNWAYLSLGVGLALGVSIVAFRLTKT